MLATTTTEDTVKFLAKRKLLANSSTCEACNRLRTIRQEPTKVDNMLWEYPNRECRRKKSVRHGSLFSDSQLSLVKLLTFIYCWAEEYPLFQCNKECCGMAEHTQTHWGLMCRGVCKDWLIEHSTQIGMLEISPANQPQTDTSFSGGMTIDGNHNIIPKVVEIDELCFTKSRSYHPRAMPSFWLFGEFILLGISSVAVLCTTRLFFFRWCGVWD